MCAGDAEGAAPVAPAHSHGPVPRERRTSTTATEAFTRERFRKAARPAARFSPDGLWRGGLRPGVGTVFPVFQDSIVRVETPPTVGPPAVSRRAVG